MPQESEVRATEVEVSKDPKTCSVPGCLGKPMYKVGTRGYCEQHKPGPVTMVRHWLNRNPLHRDIRKDELPR